MEVSGSGMKEARRKWEKNLSEVARDRSQRALWVLLAFALCQMRDFGGSEQRRGMTYVLEGPLAAGQGTD